MLKESDKYRIYALLWSIWASVHLFTAYGIKWVGFTLGLIGIGYWVATIVTGIKEAKEES